MNKIGICDKCKTVDYKKLINTIKNLDKNIEFNIGCQNMCGIGKSKPFVILNHKPVIGNTEEELIEKIKNML